jgi:hypothetical protein
VKKFAVIALSLGLLGALPVAQAASVSVDAGSFVLSYEDTFLPSSAVSVNAGVVTFSGLAYEALAINGISGIYDSFDGYAGKPYPITITAKAGFDITSVTESISGDFRASAGEPDGMAGALAGFVSRWVKVDGADILGQQTPNQLLAGLRGGQYASGDYTVSSSLNIGVPGAIALSSLELIGNAGAMGQSTAYLSLKQYQIGVQTATAVPEPGAMALVLAGIAVAGLKLRRGKKQA